jgi:hypothetical protein
METTRYRIAEKSGIRRGKMASQDRFKTFLDNIEPSTKTNVQKARTGLGYFLGGHKVAPGVRA